MSLAQNASARGCNWLVGVNDGPQSRLGASGARSHLGQRHRCRTSAKMRMQRQGFADKRLEANAGGGNQWLKGNQVAVGCETRHSVADWQSWRLVRHRKGKQKKDIGFKAALLNSC